MRSGFLHDFRGEMIAAQHSAGRIEKHQVGSAVSEREWSQNLQRQREPRLRENCVRAASRESQAEKSVAADAAEISLALKITVPGEGNDGSSR